MPSLNDKVLKIINEQKAITEDTHVKPSYTDLGPAVVSPTTTTNTDYNKGVPKQELRSGGSQKDHPEVSDISGAQTDKDGKICPESPEADPKGNGPELGKGEKVVAEDMVQRVKGHLKRFNESFVKKDDKDTKPEDKGDENNKDKGNKDKDIKEDLGADKENERQYDKQKDGEKMKHVPGQKDDVKEDLDESQIDEKLKGLPRVKKNIKIGGKKEVGVNSPTAITHQKEETDKEKDKESDDKKDMAEDINALFSGETLSEDFKKKATLIFETAVNMRVNAIVERKTQELQEQASQQLDEAISEVTEVLSEKVDTYLNYVAEEWIKENAVNIENTLRANIAEDFMQDLKRCFEQHNIEVPRSKVDMLATMVQRNDQLEEQLNNQIEKNAFLVSENVTYKKLEILREVSEGLTLTQVEKLKTLSESVDFKSADVFKQNLTILKESNFKNTSASPKAQNLTEDTNKTPIEGANTSSDFTADILKASARLNKK